MRRDMAKVVTESPRVGHNRPHVKHGGRLSKDDVAQECEDDTLPGGLKPWGRHRHKDWGKEFSDLLGPLRGYLRKQVGRPWNKIYSDLSQTLNRRTLSGQHIWRHVQWEVELHCEVRDDGLIYKKAVTRYKQDQPVDGLYVHPVNGLLCWKPERRFRYRPPTNPDEKIIDPFTTLVRQKGIWYCTTYRLEVLHVVQMMRGKEVETTSEQRVLNSKHQLSRKELKHYGVVNA